MKIFLVFQQPPDILYFLFLVSVLSDLNKKDNTHRADTLVINYLKDCGIGKENNISGNQVRRYVRLTYLIPELLKLVDETVLKSNKNGLTMGIKPAVELSYLGFAEQKLVFGVIDYCQVTPSHAQTIKIRKLAKNKKIDFNSVEEILLEKKGNQNDKISFNKVKKKEQYEFYACQLEWVVSEYKKYHEIETFDICEEDDNYIQIKNTKLLFNIITKNIKSINSNDEVIVEFGIQNKNFSAKKSDCFFRKQELLDLLSVFKKKEEKAL